MNSVYAQMAVDVGPAKVKQTAIDLGLPSDTPDLNPYPSIALGTSTASVLDMAEAYATLANHGKHGTYTIVEKITKDGEEGAVTLPKQKTKQVVTREAADTTTALLQSVVESGTATAAQAADRPVAGKTGTAEEDTAAWFAGYTPDLATVVSVMGQDPVTGKHKSLYGAMGLDRINGGGAPAEIWTQFTKAALKGKEAKEFDLQLQEGAEEQQLPPADQQPDPGTDAGQDNGGTTDGTDGGQETPGATTGTPAPPTDGTTTDGTTATGGTTTTGGTTATGGTTTDGGTTDTGGTTTDGGTTDTGGTTTDGGTTDTGGTTDSGGTTEGTPGFTTGGLTTSGRD